MKRIQRAQTSGALTTLAGAILVWALVPAGCVWEDRDLGIVNCGNGICDKGETPATCALDCPSGLCGNGLCELDEDPQSCPADCTDAKCGNGVCGDGENLYTCPDDCPWNTCGNGVCEAGEEDGGCAKDCFLPTCGNGLCEAKETSLDCPKDCPATRKADILFVVDTSGSMAEEQAALSEALPVLYANLRHASGDYPDIHLGVVTTDLGTGEWQIPDCGNSQEGNLWAPENSGLTGVPFLKDQSPLPETCDVLRDSQGNCVSYTCGDGACDTSDGTELALVEDPATGCPRCRNLVGAPEGVFQSIATPGTTGCEFVQPLKAMFRALDTSNQHNAGFLRPDALLVVVFLTAKDDCSASTTDLFDTNQTDMSSDLGPLTLFRCFEFGVVCDANARTLQGLRFGCRPRSDSGALLHPIERYRDFLLSLKQPGQLVVRALAGPVMWANDGWSVTTGLDEHSDPMVMPSCASSMGEAVPGIRLRHFLQYFNSGTEMDNALLSICSPTLVDAMEDLAVTVKRRLTF